MLEQGTALINDDGHERADSFAVLVPVMTAPQQLTRR